MVEEELDQRPKVSREVQRYQEQAVNGGSKVYDEAVDSDGRIRPAWSHLVQRIGQLPIQEIQRRITQANRQLDIDGLAFNPHDSAEDQSRPWNLNPIPLAISAAEWKQVSEGLQQRAHLSNLILLDLLGPQTLLQERILPPEVLFGHPNYYPQYHSLVARPTQHLHLYAADLSRSPDGSWWVNADRTRCPFGLGYLLENRLIMSRMLPDAFEACQVLRLAPFFLKLQNALSGLANRYRENPRIAMWTKGPKSGAYFEDAFLARYLGYNLVEGDDLAVRNGKLMLKTLAGLLPVEVLMRRVEDHMCDPAELDGSSRSGVSGLLEVVRSGNVSVSNSIGSALAESPLILAYLPSVCRHFLGEDLKLPSVATWWCGTKRAYQYVMEHFDKLLIREAHRRDDGQLFSPQHMTSEHKQQLKDRILENPTKYVGQEIISRSTAPVWESGQLHSWSLAVRSYLIADGDTYEALPGGLARVAQEPEVLLRGMTNGERSQDVWVLSEEPVEMISLLDQTSNELVLKRGGVELPSRAADNLYWLGRNLERAEQIARLARTTLQQVIGQDISRTAVALLHETCFDAKHARRQPSTDDPVLVVDAVRQLVRELSESLFSLDNSFSLRNAVIAADKTGMQVRDHISLDHVRVIGELRRLLDREPTLNEVTAADSIATLDSAITFLDSLNGISGESMTRTLAWRFLDIGRRLDRALQTASRMKSLFPIKPRQGDKSLALDFCLRAHDSYMTYRGRYLASLQLAPVVDLLLTDETNPRSILFQLDSITDHVNALPRPEDQAVLTAEQRIAVSLSNLVRMTDIADLTTLDRGGERTGLHRLLARLTEQLPKLSDALSAKFLIHAGFQRHYARTMR